MRDLREKTVLTIILIFVLLSLQACIILPIPWGKDRFSQEDLSAITLGLSSKDDVLKKFDKPDVIWETERVFIYKWERLRAIIVAGGGYKAGVGGLETDEALLILFDEADHVKRIGKATKSPFESYGEFLIRWLSQNQED